MKPPLPKQEVTNAAKQSKAQVPDCEEPLINSIVGEQMMNLPSAEQDTAKQVHMSYVDTRDAKVSSCPGWLDESTPMDDYSRQSTNSCSATSSSADLVSPPMSTNGDRFETYCNSGTSDASRRVPKPSQASMSEMETSLSEPGMFPLSSKLLGSLDQSYDLLMDDGTFTTNDLSCLASPSIACVIDSDHASRHLPLGTLPGIETSTAWSLEPQLTAMNPSQDMECHKGVLDIL